MEKKELSEVVGKEQKTSQRPPKTSLRCAKLAAPPSDRENSGQWKKAPPQSTKGHHDTIRERKTIPRVIKEPKEHCQKGWRCENVVAMRSFDDYIVGIWFGMSSATFRDI